MVRTAFIAPVVLAALLAGCAAPTAFESTPAYNRYTLEQVIQWSKAGEAPRRIIVRLDDANAFYPLTATELVSLHQQGVAPEVLDHLLDRYLRGLRHEERFQLNRRYSALP